VLVAYGTKYGATAEIAKVIGETLVAAGVPADVVSADKAGDVAAYDAVVLGSAVYAGRWREEAVDFLLAREAALAARPTWIFSSGPTGEGDPATLLKGWRFPEAQQPIADRIMPRDLAVFGGAIDADKINLAERLILKMVKAPAGDFRDWDNIKTWANGIAAALANN
jgi:menaquinone-dependent protoporphyrinogen oxidase